MSDALQRIDAGALADLTPGTVRIVPLPRSQDPSVREALVLRDGRGVVRAYRNRCQHLPIPLDGGSRAFYGPDGTQLMCRTHGALYRLEDGYCTVGPCRGRSLEPIEVELDADRVVLLWPS